MRSPTRAFRFLPVRRLRLHVAVLLASICLCLSAAPVPAQQPSSDSVASLLNWGRILYLSGLPRYARPLFQAALDQTAGTAAAGLRLRAEAEAAIYASKTQQPDIAMALVRSVRENINLAADPVSRCFARLALGYGSLGNRIWADALSQGEGALQEALAAGVPALQGEAQVLIGRAQLGLGKTAEALQKSREAAVSFSRDNAPLSQAEAYQLQANAYDAYRNPQAAAVARQKAFGVVTDLSAGPLLDVAKTLDTVRSIQDLHPVAARLGHYDKACNAVLSLLILQQTQFRLAGREAQIEALHLSASSLLAHLADYAFLRGNPEAAAVFIRIAEESFPRELTPEGRAEYRCIAARYWRRTGKAREALDQLDRASQSLSRLAPPLRADFAEETALALLLLNPAEYREKALRNFEDALAIAKTAQESDRVERLELCLALLQKGEIAQDILQGKPAALARAREQHNREALARSGPPLFQSPLAGEPGTERPPTAAEAILKTELPRPRYESLAQVDPSPYVRTGRWEKAIAIFQAGLEENGESVPLLLQLGDCYVKSGQWLPARGVFERVIALEPGNAIAAEELARLEVRLKKSAARP